MAFHVGRIDHAVYWVRNVDVSKQFYTKVLGLQEVMSDASVCLLRAPGSEQHHDLGLFQANAATQRSLHGAIGLYHLAWKVTCIEDLAEAFDTLQHAKALTGASSHGATKSLYAVDPDGNALEIVFTIPRSDWGQWESGGTVEPLNLSLELARYGAGSGQHA